MDHQACKELLSTLVCGQIHLRVIHWNTESYATHKAIGKLYEELADLTDNLAEVYMGIYGRIGSMPCEILEKDVPEAVAYVGTLAQAVEVLRKDLPNDGQLQNIIDEIAAVIDRTNYLLTLK